MPKPKFIHLHVHSDYSIIDGIAKINKIIKKIIEINMPSIAITDFTNLYGLIKFYTEAQKNGIKPIIGADFYLQNEIFHNEITYITILAKNNTGYKNLILLISKAYKNGYKKIGPTIKKEWLLKYKKGLILISNFYMGDIITILSKNDKHLTKITLDFYKKNFKNNFYLEIVRIGKEKEEDNIKKIINISIINSIPVVATNNVRFINQNDFLAHEIRVAIDNKVTLINKKKIKNYTKQQYLKTESEMINIFSDIPEAIKNSVEIAKRCNVEIELNKKFLPKFNTGKMKIENFLIKESRNGLKKRLTLSFKNIQKKSKKYKKYEKRLKQELQTINNIGLPGYFLIVMEFIQWSKKNKILVGPGRGSGAGSLVAYSLGITDIDPIKFNLLFERFLNTERITMPDIDIDFCMKKRDKVIEHVSKKYGKESVSQIITFGTMAAKAAIKDVGRVLGYSFNFTNYISKLIPFDPNITIKKAFEIEPELKKIYNSNIDAKEIIDMAKKLEGITRNPGKHAGGVIISPTKITDFSPIYCDQNGQNILTQFDKNDIEKIGLIKFDFLGLKTLTIIDLSKNMININNTKNKLPPIDLNNIYLNDSKCYKNLQTGETTGIFQLESKGIKNLVKKLNPDKFDDIVAIIALFRPGPLKSGMVENFINRKNGLEKISYPHPKWESELLKPILKPTYGIILYQEQVMEIAQKISGYTLGQADILRHAMSKKNSKEMKKQKSFFKKGAKKNGIESNLSEKIFSLLEKFSLYGFNKSHSTAYALLSYQTLWLKTYYPAEFMASALTVEIDNTEKIVILIHECWRMGLKIDPPNINNGLYQFYAKNNKIIYGIGAIKGIGEIAIKSIIKSRNKYGNFKNIFDLCKKVDSKKINKKIIENLILSGSCDNFGVNRATLIMSINHAIKAADQYNYNKSFKQCDMFDIFDKKEQDITHIIKNIPELSKQEILKGEKDTLGIYLTGHPTYEYSKEIEFYTNKSNTKIIQHQLKNNKLKIIGLLSSIKIIITKNKKKICLCTIEDAQGQIEIVLFSKTLEKHKHLLKKDKIVFIEGKIKFDHFNSSYKIIVFKMKKLSQIREKHTKHITINLENKQIKNSTLEKISNILNNYSKGKTPLYINIQNTKYNKNIIKYKKNWTIFPSNSCLNKIKHIVGKNKIKIKFKQKGKI